MGATTKRPGAATPPDWERLKEVVSSALELDTAARSAFVAAACGEDTALRREVHSILAQTPDRFDLCVDRLTSARSAAEPLNGRRLGAYQVVEEIGRGGMGAVYLARRADKQFEKEVAIKVLKRGTDTDEVLRRFRAERLILARLEHPNIARMLDAGTTDDDLPYFVMEYVVGERITDFCSARALRVRDRIELFLKVCGAVQFAHRNLIVHRDLKPGNILVTSEGEPKLLDFGIAKLVAGEGDFPEATLTLPSEQRLTPGYASPEQVRGEPVTTVSDVYSLGALLYELLTGEAPHRFSASRPSASELVRIVAEEESRAASVAASSSELRRELRGDLDNILRNALRKEPERRYSGVTAFADDLRRYLRGMPVRARRDTLPYRAGKFVTRHKLGVAVATALVISLLGGMVATTVQRRRAERLQARAEAGEEANRRLLYSAQMALAYDAWEAGNIERVVQLLEAQRPKSGQPDLRSFEWSLLWQLTHENSKVFRATGSSLHGVAFSPDGKRIVGSDRDGSIHLWEVGSERVRTFSNAASVEGDVLFTADGAFLVGAAGNGAAVWSADSGEVVARFAGHSAAALDVALSPDGRLLATSSADGTAKLWNVSTGEQLLTLAGHAEIVTSISFSPNGETVATTSRDRTVRLWDTQSGRQLSALEGHTWWVRNAAFSPDGKLLASGGSDGEIKLWDVARHVELRTIRGLGVTVEDVEFSTDGELLFIATRDNTITVRDVETGKVLDVLRGHEDVAGSLAAGPGGALLASASDDGTVRLWDLRNRAGATTFDGHRDWAWDVAYSPDGRVLASASKDGTVKLWDAETRRQLLTLEHRSWVNSVRYSRDGSMLATGADDGLVRLWNSATGELVATLRGHADVVESVAFSPVGGLLASGGKNGEVIFWDTATHKEIARPSADESRLVWMLAFSPDGRLLAVAELNKTPSQKQTPQVVRIFDVASGQVVARLATHTAFVRAVAFAPDGKTLATGGEDRTIRLWNLANGEQTALLKTHAVATLAFSKDGRRLVSGGLDRTVKIWDVAAAAELCTLNVPSEPTALAFSSNGTALAVAAKDNKVHQWHIATPE